MKTSRTLRLTALAAAALGLTQASVSAQTLDVQIASIEVSQALPSDALSIPLTAGRSTYVRVEASLTNPPGTSVDLDGIMRVYVNGVEVPESPIYSRNGPYKAKVNPNLNVRNGTLNFMYLPPASSNVVFEVELNPPGPNFVPESNTTNNTMSTPVLSFQERAVVEFAYLPIDYRPGGGGGPNLPDPNLIDPGVGDNFIQGIYPGKDIYYHRVDQPSLLWTSSLTNSGSGLLNSMFSFWLGMSPRPDFLYGWVPGALPNYNGQAQLNSAVSMGNTQAIRHQRTYAHEVGHNTGLSHTGWSILERGVDQEHHLNITEGLPFIKDASLRNIMDAGLLTQDAWVRDTHYESFYNHPKWSPPSPSAPTFTDPVISVSGLYDVATRTFTLDPTMLADPIEATPSTTPLAADFEVSAYRGSDLAHRVYTTSTTVTDSCSGEPRATEGSTDSLAGVPDLSFNALITQGSEPFDRLVIKPMGRVEAEPIVIDRSANAPELRFVSPTSADVIDSTRLTLEWAADDLDGDELSYYVRYSRDGSAFTPLHLGSLKTTSLEVDLTELPQLISGQSFFEVQATDGLNFTVLRTDGLVGTGSVLGLLVNPPFVNISTPDSGKSYDRAATVILHAGGWDIEDRELEGGDMVWTSDVDGVIGTGRLTSTTSLSVGVHNITVTGTDSSGLFTSDTHTITIDDRGLPGEGSTGPVVYCTPGTSASGCQATLSSVGTPSATAATGFTVTAGTVEGVKDGLFFFGTSGRQANSWGSGSSFQCVVPPTIRTGVLSGTGTLGVCDGSASRDMNATWTAVPAKNPGAGALVQLQFWYRDPQNTSNQTTSLSDALEFTVEP